MGLFDVVGNLLGTNGAPDAISQQQQGANNSNAALQSAYTTQQGLEKPYVDAGTTALSGMQNPNFQQSFDMSKFQQDPGYQFQMQQGDQAIQRAAAAGGVSGGTLKSLQSYGQGLANQDYQQAYNNYNTNQQNQFGRLATVAGMGQTATGQAVNSSMNLGNQESQTAMGLGNAQAAATMGQANMNAGMFNGIMQAGGTAIARFCDERLKTDIEPVSKEDLAELKENLTAYKFRYRNEKHGKGDFIGVMAQDLQKSKLGSSLVFKDHEGHLQIDVSRVLMLFLASMAEV